MPITRTHTKTYALMDPWASSIPWEPATCRKPCNHTMPHVGDQCAVEDCRKPLLSGEVMYKVTQRSQDEYVCWRHVQPNNGPIKV